jgi:hypothetical protein
MAIRLRKIEDKWVALCAYETDKKEGDIYIDDGQHYALITKFRDEHGFDPDKIIKKLMDSQKVRDALERTDL